MTRAPYLARLFAFAVLGLTAFAGCRTDLATLDAPVLALPAVPAAPVAPDAATLGAHSADGVAAAAGAWVATIPAAAPGRFAAFCEPAPVGMVCVRGGTITRGVDTDADGCHQTGDPPEPALAATPAQRVWVDTFYLDAHEVTIEEYARCVEAGACAEAGPVYIDFDRPTQPITGVNWFHAAAYCAWAGGDLPTEAQFEAAARGPDGARTPFGDALVDCDVAVIMDERGRSCGITKRGQRPEAGRVLEVGSRPAGRYGVFDLVGNAEEWSRDWWTPSWEACGDACAGPNPRGPCDGAVECPGHRYRTVRGGSWYWPPACATGYHRRRHTPQNEPMHHFGFRCAASVEQAAAMRVATGDAAAP